MFGKARINFGLHGVATLASRLAGDVVAKAIPLGRLWWAAILLLGISASAVGWTIWQLRDDAIRAAISDSGNIAAVLAGQLARSLQSIDTVLLEVRDPSKESDIDRPFEFRDELRRRAFYRSLIAYRNRLPQVFNIAIADEDGRVVVSTAAWPTPNINVADRDYFNDARARLDGGLSTSVPIDNRIDGTRTIVFARRLERPNGEFSGIVYASVNSKYFEDIYGSTQSVHSLIFTLVREDGTILFRHPGARDFAGEKLSAEMAWSDAVSKGIDGYSVLGRSDGKVRFVSVRAVPGYPTLFVNTSVTESVALEGWIRRSAMIGLGSTALLLCSLYLLIAVTRQVRCLSDSEASLLQTSQQLDAALNNMPQGLSMFDSQQRLVICNKNYAEMYGLLPEQTRPGTPLRAILESRVAIGNTPEKQDFVADHLARVALRESYYAVDETRDGRIFSISHQLMNNGGWVAIHQDITSQKRVEAELAHMARYDPLTGLANRAVFLAQTNEALARERQLGERFSILMLDLDQFKAVNDSLGHATGDSLLQAVARRFHRIMHDVDRVARFGGDEFALLQIVEKDQDHRESAIALADRILAAITEPYDLDGRKVAIGVSIGITVAPDDGCDADALIRNADLALYKAKSEGRNRYHFFEASMEAQARQRRELEDDMRKAIARDEFELHYQTIIDVETGVAVNLSPMQFKTSNLLDVMKSALRESGFAPTRLELEITETVLIEKNEENLAVLHQLKNLGASIVLDDFGIGYSSMRYLQVFPIDKIKIDKSFIQSMPNHSDSVAIVCAIAGLARNLDIETTAEGVETAEQFALLRGAGCQMAQGYLFSRPVPASKLSFERTDAAQAAAAQAAARVA